MSSPSNTSATKEPLAPLWVGVAIFLFFPLGLYLLWRHPTLGKNGKWWASAMAWACFVMFMGNKAEEKKASEARSEGTHEVVAEASDDSRTADESSTAEDSHAASGDQPTGKKFSAKEMEALYKKAFKLRLGMSAQEVFAIMGPPTKRELFDPSEHTLPGLPVVDPRLQDTAFWSSVEDPGSAFVMVNLLEGRANDIVANKKGGEILSLSASR